jgi:hypothetical protein
MTDTIFDKSTKYGWRFGGTRGISMTATNADYANRMGANFVYSSGGIVRMCTSAQTTVDGWLNPPKETTHGAAVQLGGAPDEYFVITDPTAVFECPADESVASLANKQGLTAYIVHSGSTTTFKQKVKVATGACATDQLFVHDIDTVNHTIFVSMMPDAHTKV